MGERSLSIPNIRPVPHRAVLVKNYCRTRISRFEQRPHPRLQPLPIDSHGKRWANGVKNDWNN